MTVPTSSKALRKVGLHRKEFSSSICVFILSYAVKKGETSCYFFQLTFIIRKSPDKSNIEIDKFLSRCVIFLHFFSISFINKP